MPSITVQCEGTEENFALEAAVVTVGRGLESDIRIKDIKASRRHCQVVKTAQGFKLVDLESGNGTFLNGIQVKEQALRNGDKIQIGHTVLVFENGMEQPKKTGTAALPKVGAARKGETARIATGQTRRNEAVPGKAATSKLPAQSKPATASAPSKGATSKIQKQPGGSPTTRRSGTGTGKVPTTGRTTARAVAPRKHANPMILVGIGVVVLAGIIAALAFGGVFESSANPEIIKEKLHKAGEAAAKLADKGDYEGAKAKYRECLEIIKQAKLEDRFKSDIVGINAAIKQIDDDVAEAQRIADLWAKWKAKYDKIGGEGGVDKIELMTEAKNLLDSFRGKPWYNDFISKKDQLQLMINTDAAVTQRQDFQVFINSLNDKYKWAHLEEGKWGPAVKELKEYVAKTATAADKPKAESKITEIDGRARQFLKRLVTRAEKAETKPDGVKMLEARREQFVGGGVEEELNKAIEDLKK